MTTPSVVSRYWPIITSVVGALVVVATLTGVARFQINVNAAEIDVLEEDIDENADDIEQLRRDQIRQEGKTALELQQLQTDIGSIGSKIDTLILLQRRAVTE